MVSLLVVVWIVVSALVVVIAISMLAIGMIFFFKRFRRVLIRKGNPNV